MPGEAKPSEHQLAALLMMFANGGRIERRPGGYWTWHGCPSHEERVDRPPISYVSTLTVRALESRGWIERANVHPEIWRDERLLTPAGRLLADRGTETGCAEQLVLEGRACLRNGAIDQFILHLVKWLGQRDRAAGAGGPVANASAMQGRRRGVPHVG